MNIEYWNQNIPQVFIGANVISSSVKSTAFRPLNSVLRVYMGRLFLFSKFVGDGAFEPL